MVTLLLTDRRQSTAVQRVILCRVPVQGIVGRQELAGILQHLLVVSTVITSDTLFAQCCHSKIPANDTTVVCFQHMQIMSAV